MRGVRRTGHWHPTGHLKFSAVVGFAQKNKLLSTFEKILHKKIPNPTPMAYRGRLGKDHNGGIMARKYTTLTKIKAREAMCRKEAK